MNTKKSKVLVMLMAVFAMVTVDRVGGHLPPGACIDRCLKECKGSGMGVASCVKYCPVHCLPPDTHPHTSTKEHYCNLGCMLDQCSKYITDEKKMTECVIKCRKYHCNITNKIVE